MLKERLYLMEKDFEKLRKQAAKLYLKIVTGNCNESDIECYAQLKTQLADFGIEQDIIKSPIAEGME